MAKIEAAREVDALVLTKVASGAMLCKQGGIVNIIDCLTDRKAVKNTKSLQFEFLLTYRYHLTTVELVYHLILRYFAPPETLDLKPTVPNDEARKRAHIRFRYAAATLCQRCIRSPIEPFRD